MKFFGQKKKQDFNAVPPEIQTAERCGNENFSLPFYAEECEKQLYDRLRFAVPVIDAALSKIVRLTGGYAVISSDADMQEELDFFLENVPVGLSGKSINSFTDCYLDNLLTYGNAAGEIVLDSQSSRISGLYLGEANKIKISYGKSPSERCYYLKTKDGCKKIRHPERILFTALGSTDGRGRSVLRGLPALSGILMRIYQCIGQNFDRAGNIRYAVTYKPSADSGERSYAKERAIQIAKEWSDGMNSAKYGQVKQFLYSPQEALVYRDKYDKRAGLEYYCLYSGYNGEDLSDLVSFGSLQKRKISLVKIYGGSNGIFTELGVYVDDFNN